MIKVSGNTRPSREESRRSTDWTGGTHARARGRAQRTWCGWKLTVPGRSSRSLTPSVVRASDGGGLLTPVSLSLSPYQSTDALSPVVSPVSSLLALPTPCYIVDPGRSLVEEGRAMSTTPFKVSKSLHTGKLFKVKNCFVFYMQNFRTRRML